MTVSFGVELQKRRNRLLPGNSITKATSFLIMLSPSLQLSAGDGNGTTQSDQEIFYQQAISQINPRHVRWVKSTANDVYENQLDEPAVIDLTTKYLNRRSSGLDVFGLAFLVMMEYSKRLHEDSRGLQDNILAKNEKAKALQEARKQLNENRQNVTRQQLDSYQLLLNGQSSRTVVANPSENSRLRMSSQTVTKAEIDATNDQLRDNLVTVNEMEEMDMLRLQMAMERQSKAQSTLSNLIKKISQSRQSIIQNLK